LWTNLRHCPRICLEGLRKTTKIFKTVGVPAEIGTRHLTNTRHALPQLANRLHETAHHGLRGAKLGYRNGEIVELSVLTSLHTCASAGGSSAVAGAVHDSRLKNVVHQMKVRLACWGRGPPLCPNSSIDLSIALHWTLAFVSSVG
jgi:hypothetical protein